jgi:hypothetical protein
MLTSTRRWTMRWYRVGASVGLIMLPLLLCVACAAGTRYHLPATSAGLQTQASTAEASYQMLYKSFKMGDISKASMAHVDILYESWRQTNQFLIDAVQAGALGLRTE